MNGGARIRRAGRRFWLCALVVCFCPATATAAPLLPDLVADPPVGGNAPVVYGDAQGSRLLLRMDGFVHNRGAGALELRGTNRAGTMMRTVTQRVYDSAGGFADRPSAATILYETDDDHDHWHLRSAMRYSLWSADRSAEVAPSQKVGFCLLDSERVEAPAGATETYTEAAGGFCRADQPQAADAFMGVSAGWRDIYPYTLAFQWIDISDVAPGRYWLRTDADPDGVVAEAVEANPPAYAADMSVVPGHRAEPVAAGRVQPGTATEIALAATTYDEPALLVEPGPREFSVVTPPAHGTLNVATGAWFAGSSVRYTPAPGYSGTDTFSVVARDATSPFPRTPPSAAVTLDVAASEPQPEPEPLVLGISGAPESVRTGSSTQLTATGPGVDRGVEWSATAGTISSEGLYRAPATPGRATISARSAAGATGSVEVRVKRAGEPRPAPTLKPPPVPRRGLSRIKLQLHDDQLMAVVSSAQTGRVRFEGRLRGLRFGGCSLAVRRGGAATCRMRVPLASARTTSAFLCRVARAYQSAPSGIVVRAGLSRKGRTVARRRAALRPS